MRLLLAAFMACVLCAGQPLPESGGSSIGVVLQDIDADRAAILHLSSAAGVEVVAVDTQSPAERSGLKAGDVLLSYNSEPIQGGEQLGRLVRETPVGRKIRLQYWRAGKLFTTTVTTVPRRTMEVTMRDRPMMGLDVNDMFIPSFPTPHFSWINSQFGIECEGLDSQSSQLADFFGVKRGVLIRAVGKDSPAAKAGLKAGDVLTGIDGHPVSDAREVDGWLQREARSAQSFPVTVMRDRKPATVKVNLMGGER